MPFRTLFPWRPQKVVYDELPDQSGGGTSSNSQTSQLTLWAEGSFVRDLNSYQYAEPSSNCLTSKNILHYLGEIVSTRLICATFTPGNPFEIEFGTYVSLLNVDVETQLVWFQGYVHSDCVFGEQFEREVLQDILDLEDVDVAEPAIMTKKAGRGGASSSSRGGSRSASVKSSPRFSNATSSSASPRGVDAPDARAKQQRQVQQAVLQQLAEVFNSSSDQGLGQQAGVAGERQRAYSFMSAVTYAKSVAGKKLLESRKGSSSGRNGVKSGRNGVKTSKNSATGSASGGVQQGFGGDDPGDDFSGRITRQAARSQFEAIVSFTQQRRRQMLLQDNKKFAVPFSEFEHWVYDVIYAEPSTDEMGQRVQPTTWLEQAVTNTVVGLLSNLAAESPAPAAYDIFKSLCRPEFHEQGIDQLRFYTIVNRWSPRLTERDLQSLWRECDLDGDNFLNYVEFYRLFEIAKVFAPQ